MKARTSELRIIPQSSEAKFQTIVTSLNNRFFQASWKLKALEKLNGVKLEKLVELVFAAPAELFPNA